jgi:S1-C subfamily serine protease
MSHFRSTALLLAGLLLGAAVAAEQPPEKRALGLGERRLAFRQDDPVSAQGRAAGLRPRDVVVGVDGMALEMTGEQFLGHVRRNFLLGDRITLNVLRDGKPLDLPLTLR